MKWGGEIKTVNMKMSEAVLLWPTQQRQALLNRRLQQKNPDL